MRIPGAFRARFTILQLSALQHVSQEFVHDQNIVCESVQCKAVDTPPTRIPAHIVNAEIFTPTV